MATEKKAPARRATPKKAKVPDLVGRPGRVRQIAEHLAQVQVQRTNLDIAVTRHGLGDKDPAPGYRDKTVKQERDDLAAQEKRIVEEYAEFMPDVEALLKGGDEQ